MMANGPMSHNNLLNTSGRGSLGSRVLFKVQLLCAFAVRVHLRVCED